MPSFRDFNMIERMNETIVAIGTPAGSAARGMVRLSGDHAFDICDKLFRPGESAPRLMCRTDDASRSAPGVMGEREAAKQSIRAKNDPTIGMKTFVMDKVNCCIAGRIALAHSSYSLPAEVYLYFAPHSYTRENIVEFHTVGSQVVLVTLVKRCLDLGAKQALPGEFTARAFYRGALSLSDVRGIGALISARDDTQLRVAHRWFEGNFSRRLSRIRDELIEIISLVEATLDFSEEEIDFIDAPTLAQRIDLSVHQMQELARLGASSERFGVRPRVVLMGRPNVGKSTLMNLLSGTNRSVCSEMAGTTRDDLTALIRVSDRELELVDTAGLGEKSEKRQKKIKKSLPGKMGRADLICYVFDLTKEPLEEQLIYESVLAKKRVLWVGNKADLLCATDRERVVRQAQSRLNATVVVTSAMTGEGLESLKSLMDQYTRPGTENYVEQEVMIGPTSRSVLDSAIHSLLRARECCAESDLCVDVAECIASDMREALTHLEELFGAVDVEQILTRIFSDFCVGK